MQVPTPSRPIPLWRLLLRGWGWVSVFTVPFVLIVGGIALHAGYHVTRLATDGVTTEAQITAKRRENADPSSRPNGRQVYYLDYTFTVDGTPIADSTRVSESFSHSVRRLDTVPLRYAASNPLVNEIEPGGYAADLRRALLFLAVGLALTGPILWHRWRTARQMIWVRDHGEERSAIIISQDTTGLHLNNRKAYRVNWKDETGAVGRSTLVNRHGLAAFPVGSEIRIYADPTEKRPPVWQVEVGPPAK